MNTTAAKLTAALIAAGAPDDMVSAARMGYYDDYRSPLTAPITQLVADANRYGLDTIAERAREGDFDGTTEEADAWAKSPEGQEAFRDLLGGLSQG